VCHAKSTFTVAYDLSFNVALKTTRKLILLHKNSAYKMYVMKVFYVF